MIKLVIKFKEQVEYILKTKITEILGLESLIIKLIKQALSIYTKF